MASYAGLVPSTYQSGVADRHGHITKRTPAELWEFSLSMRHFFSPVLG